MFDVKTKNISPSVLKYFMPIQKNMNFFAFMTKAVIMTILVYWMKKKS